MSAVVNIAGMDVEVVRKPIKNVHLSVLPPNGAVRIASPLRLDESVIRSFLLSKLSWIRQQQTTLSRQPRETKREYLYLESHYVWGKRYLLHIADNCAKHDVIVEPGKLTVDLWGAYSEEKAERVLLRWYRDQVRQCAEQLMFKWTAKIGVQPNALFVQKMKTRWGGCNPTSRNIRLNSELGKKPEECLEYILVHELIHLIEPTHSDRFHSLLKSEMPDWKARRNLLNSLPLSHEDWVY